MAVNQGDVERVKGLLTPDEKIIMTASQSRIAPGGNRVVPSFIVATDRRVIMVNRSALGLRGDYESIPYEKITEVRLDKGIIFSSVFIRIEGFSEDKGLIPKGKEEGEIVGLNADDARQLADYVNQRIDGRQSPQDTAPTAQDADPGIYCSKCGAKNSADAKFCEKCGSRIVR
ncbi:MAG: PH domain-containing protein [Candidatus Micrarchaeota archaeon]|nr:PH domain-containing protein [Candidatus Micrarchaeota archaeon]